MPGTKHRGDAFARYDAMSTVELQQLLREDASKPAGEGSDTEALFYVMEVLAKRRKARGEGKSPEEALESFKQKYGTESERYSDSESVPAASNQRGMGRWMRGLIAAAAMLVFIVGGSLTACAMGFDLWENIAKWTKETFHFGYAGQLEESNVPSIEFDYPCASLQDTLNQCNITAALVPTWMPDGYVEGDVEVTQTPKHRTFKANYSCADSIIVIRIAAYLDSNPMQIEQSDSLVEIYPHSGIDYYIFDNDGFLQAVWIHENYECFISGPLSLPDLRTIIDSIEKG